MRDEKRYVEHKFLFPKKKKKKSKQICGKEGKKMSKINKSRMMKNDVEKWKQSKRKIWKTKIFRGERKEKFMITMKIFIIFSSAGEFHLKIVCFLCF